MAELGDAAAGPFARTRLWKRLAEDAHLVSVVSGLRDRASTIGAFSVMSQPSMTDHSIRHFDALWNVADSVLNPSETGCLTPVEAFLLGASFYVHDLGMAHGSNDASKANLRQTGAYMAAQIALGASPNSDAIALQVAARRTHAERAIELCTRPLSGSTGEYLIEAGTDRTTYGHWIGVISASHHWSIQRLQTELGEKGRVPLGGGSADLGLVAALLRIIDFAHINADRASTLDRALRPAMPRLSLEHWLAQEHISGPQREGKFLVYNSSRPIADVDSWWLFYSMLRGLDEEIRATRQFLETRPSTAGWLSLEGVLGALTPESASRWISPDGFEPLDVKVKGESIGRIVDLLGGKTLYGASPLAAVRELLQNALDAIRLRQAVDGESTRGCVTIELKPEGDATNLSVHDDGIGMDAHVIRDYLLAVASNYWTSEKFTADVGSTIAASFRPAGRFGVGFLSVFMLGDRVEVRSQRLGALPVLLRLRGTDRIGELRTDAIPTAPGTTVRVSLNTMEATSLSQSFESVLSLAPMASIRIRTSGVHSGASDAGLWHDEPVPAFLDRVRKTIITLGFISDEAVARDMLYDVRVHRRLRGRGVLSEGLRDSDDFGTKEQWGDTVPDIMGDDYRVVASGALGNCVIVCSRGIAIRTVWCPGFVGLVDEGEVKVDVSRSRLVDYSIEARRVGWVTDVQPQVRVALDHRSREFSLASLQDFIGVCISNYGDNLLDKSDLHWMYLFSAFMSVA